MRRPHRCKALLAVAFIIAGAAPCAALDQEMAFGDVARRADLIFAGTVERLDSRFNDAGIIVTDAVFVDIDRIHSTAGSVHKGLPALTLTYAGGCVGEQCMGSSDAPALETGARYLIFTRDDGRSYVNPVIGGSQGLFHLVWDDVSQESYVLTAGRRALVKADEEGLGASRMRVSSILNGQIIEEPPDHALAEAAFLVPPTPADPSERAWVLALPERDPVEQHPLTLDAFAEYIRRTALDLPPEGAAPAARSIGSGRAPAGSQDWTIRRPSGGTYQGLAVLHRCGYQWLNIVMEVVPQSWWSYLPMTNSMWTWNQTMDIYRQRSSDGTIGFPNGQSEFAGWLDQAAFSRIYGVNWNDKVAWCAWWWMGTCGRITETDIVFNPAWSFTDDLNTALGSSNTKLIRPVIMHELGHSWGMQTNGESYDYNVPSVMHSAYSNLVEDGKGIHAIDAKLLRSNYSNQTGILPKRDVGVESYYAQNGLIAATTDRTQYYAGDTINLRGVTVENMSYNSVADVRLRFYLSTNRQISTQDRQMGSYWYWTNFQAESYAVDDYQTTIPADIAPGRYYVGVIATLNGFQSDNLPANNSTSFYNPINIDARPQPPPASGGGSIGGLIPIVAASLGLRRRRKRKRVARPGA